MYSQKIQDVLEITPFVLKEFLEEAERIEENDFYNLHN